MAQHRANWDKEKISTYVEPAVKKKLEKMAKANERSVAAELRLLVLAHMKAL